MATSKTRGNPKSKLKVRKQRFGPGTVIAIPLPKGRFAYAKLHNDHDFGIYDFLSKEIEPLEKVIAHDFAFFYAGTDDAIKSGAWPIVGEQPFTNKEAAWGPPRVGGVLPQDNPGMPPGPLLFHKGKTRPAKLADVIGLDVELFFAVPEGLTDIIQDRLIKGKHDGYKVKG
jgi:immunity protein 26 of polymorphic toxin system